MRETLHTYQNLFCYTGSKFAGGDFMDFSEATRKRIKELCKDKNMNINKLGNNAGMNPSTIRSILKKHCKAPKSDTVYLICIGFGITMKEFYDSELFDNIDED